MAIRHQSLILLLFCLLLFGCSPIQHISKTDVKFETIQSDQQSEVDSSINAMIAPYKVQIDEEMSEVIGTVARELTKNKPESTLGNFYADAMMAGARKEDPDVDFAIANYGGIRVPYLSPGPLTKGQIFELSPFDNLLVIVSIPGNLLDTLMQKLAGMGGWPVSSAIKMTIQHNSLVEYTVHGKAAMPSAIYKVAMPDYLANGGDGLKELIPLERIQSGKLIRDMIMHYVIETTASGQKIDARIEGRIVNAK
jgi:2',3'-cyclic-nucleotide 2'-phosphodiesterase (5'-nucleotidase family)